MRDGILSSSGVGHIDGRGGEDFPRADLQTSTAQLSRYHRERMGECGGGLQVSASDLLILCLHILLHVLKGQTCRRAKDAAAAYLTMYML